MGKNLKEFTVANFQAEVLESPVPVLVDFWAKWCMPCRQIGPYVEQIAEDFAGRAKVGKLDIDINEDIAATYNVRSIPTLLVFKGGQVVGSQTGASTKDVIAQLLERNL
ncbi:MAG: thioredoxin [Acidobacteria bacterium]|nr:thioredoxin [Acidobacteriota bacterium]